MHSKERQDSHVTTAPVAATAVDDAGPVVVVKGGPF